ncbi:MAG TPA: hypothetical protein VGJ93_00175 [Desulfuromonadaceae bacterium]|jgi:hypothetical protein
MKSSGKTIRPLLVIAIFVISASKVWAGTDLPVAPQQDCQQDSGVCREAPVDLKVLQQRIAELEARKVVTVERLHQKKILRLKEITSDVKLQRLSTSDFERFVTWMSANLAGYNRYIQAGSYAALLAKMLPIPYAGQASIFTKFISQFTVALNAASVSINNYHNSSQKFIALTDAIDPLKADEKKIQEAADFAERQLLKDMTDAQSKLAMISDLSAGALSFLESLNHYVSGTDEYWNKMKGVFKKDIDPKEKSYISESTGNLRTQAERFNKKLLSFEALGKKETVSVKSLTVYDELAAEANFEK